MRAFALCPLVALAAVVALGARLPARMQPATASQSIDLAERLAAGKLRGVNREVTPLSGDRRGVHVNEKEGSGVAWVEGTDLAQGTIEMDIRGRDLPGRSFVGIAFHRKDDNSYEAVYLRPFNFRATDPVRHDHAVQYISMPDFDWPVLRDKFAEEFENPVDQSLEPAGWVALRVVVDAAKIHIYAGAVTSPTLEVRKLGALDRGMVGLWVGNGSDGDFSNLRITPAK